MLAAVGLAPSILGATFRDAEKLFLAGEYEDCASMAAAEIEQGIRFEPWRHVKAKAEMALGRYAEARETVEEGITSYPTSIEMRLLAHQVFRFNDKPQAAQTQLQQVANIVRTRLRRRASPDEQLAMGQFLLEQGADARQVLELCYDPVTKAFPSYVDGYLATARLALDKYDNRLAASTLQAVPETSRNHPDYHYLLARTFLSDNPERANEALDKALEINPRHTDSLLIVAEKLIDGEQYDEAHQTLAEVLKINPKHPQALAFEAVLANLEGEPDRERAQRKAALDSWSQNPEVDYTIGAKLSDKYRFAEGAAYQRRALAMDSSYLPARVQLAQDLLRLGDEAEGWQLIQQVFETDGYNVVAHNLVTLHDSLDDYRVLQNDSFRVRMPQHEAAIYGQRVLELLDEAKRVLCEKYEVELSGPVVVDIFANKNDFAVRTFGIPGADGFLGVCFGNVITANSPSALGADKSNWEAVLWHEFCHVVTLQKSHNKMPRWLSEGMSVYEELERDGGWGQTMNPTYRQFILDGQMAPLSELSSMFLAPESPMQLQFAYFESAMAVEYIVENYGVDSLKQMLDDLARGDSINETLVRHVAPLGKLDAEFRDYLLEQANQLGAKLDWEEATLPASADSEMIAQWLEDHPDNFYGLVRQAQALVQEEDWPAALEVAQRLRELIPEYTGAGNAYAVLARAYRELHDTAAEREALEAWAQRDGDAMDAYLRLIELGRTAEDWQLVAANARRMLAVDPLTPIPHRHLAEAAEQQGEPSAAIAAYRALLQFDTVNPVNAHYRLAQLLRDEGHTDQARREVLLALQDAPRFLDAHRLLLELAEADTTSADEEPPTSPDEPAGEDDPE
ncbi:tetratricopeptide repeat protein [Aeoliella sp. ICT_H6.2]|uniref:Tetratricopeptide repeat protein n=1 Tax=Aeoliella straminimaris TaxID=2954799 RepID=A0A9X2FBY6_9BACT|nr:tetratricopeptide repeat protein [Aeoliella straminimaris]MCO6043176.1 tetratricopeptide repeat protein [Aeoliella straminimaris]